MKLKIYKLWEGADESDLRYTEVEVKGNYLEYTQLPEAPDYDDNDFENTRRFFRYTKDTRFEKMFKTIKPNYFIEVFHAAAYEGNDASSIAGLSGYAHLNLFQKIYLDWNNNKLLRTFLYLPKIVLDRLGFSVDNIFVKILQILWWIFSTVSIIIGILFNKEFIDWLTKVVNY